MSNASLTIAIRVNNKTESGVVLSGPERFNGDITVSVVAMNPQKVTKIVGVLTGTRRGCYRDGKFFVFRNG